MNSKWAGADAVKKNIERDSSRLEKAKGLRALVFEHTLKSLEFRLEIYEAAKKDVSSANANRCKDAYKLYNLTRDYANVADSITALVQVKKKVLESTAGEIDAQIESVKKLLEVFNKAIQEALDKYKSGE